MKPPRTLLAEPLRKYRSSLLVHGAAAVVAGALVVSACASFTWTGLLATPLAGVVLVLVIPSFRRRLSLFLVVGLGLPAMLSASEVAFRLRYFGTDGMTAFSRYSPVGLVYLTGLLRVSDEPRLGFEATPGYRGTLKGAECVLNSAGFRDREFEGRKPSGTRRAVVVGNSFTMGAGVESEELFTRRLESLITRPGDEWQVYNFGVGAYGLEQDTVLLRGLEYQPDIVLYAVSSRSVTWRAPRQAPDWPAIMQRNQRIGERLNLVRQFSFVLNLLPGPAQLRELVRSTVRRLMPGDAKGTVPPYLLEPALRRLDRELEKHGIPLAVVILRELDFGAGREAIEENHRRTRELCASLGIRCIDTASAFPPDSKLLDLIIYPGDHHPSGESHARYATCIAEALEDLGPPAEWLR